jgi:hypothetical protein
MAEEILPAGTCKDSLSSYGFIGFNLSDCTYLDVHRTVHGTELGLVPERTTHFIEGGSRAAQSRIESEL